MSGRVDEIEWGQPLLPLPDDPAWAAELKRAFGTDQHAYRYLARSPWLRTTALRATTAQTTFVDERLAALATLVTSQENACRFCYGNARAYLKLLGQSDAQLDRVERDMKTAGADEKERALLRFCRNLSRSNPRPALSEVDGLVAMGYERPAIIEIAFLVATTCLANRVATFMAMPLEMATDENSIGWWARFSFSLGRRFRRKPARASYEVPAADGPFSQIVGLIEGTVGAPIFDQALRSAFASPVLSVRTKAWIFAVVAHALDCHVCEAGAARLLEAEGVAPETRMRVLDSLAGSELDDTEAILLPWVRETVHYQTEVMQRKTHELRKRVGDDMVLDVIGVAALANACSRLSMLGQ